MSKKLWLLVLVLLVPWPAHAESIGFAVSPPVVELVGNPGEQVSSSVQVTNLTDQTLTLDVDRRGFVAKGDEGQVDLVDTDSVYNLVPWFSIQNPSLELPARSTRSFEFNIQLPANAEPGGRYGSLVFHTRQVKLPSGQSGASVRQDLAALIFLRVAGDAHEQIKIDSFQAARQFYEKGPVVLSAKVQNLGNVHNKPTGVITIKNILGLTVASLPIDAKNILPEATRRLDTTWRRSWLVGYYRAQLVLNNSDQQRLVASTSFFVVPYKALIVLLVILLLLYWLVWRRRARLHRAFKILFGKD